jgi:hypothetical protein
MPTIPYVRATHSDGQSWSAAKANLLEAGCNDLSYSPTVRAHRTAVQTLTTATWTLLLWNTETGGWDTAGNAADTMHDNSTNPGRLTCRYAGKYQVTLCTVWASNTTGIRAAVIQKNSEALPATVSTGVYQGGYLQSASSTGATIPISAPATVDLAVNDYVAVAAYQSSGGNLDILVDSYFGMTRVA